MSQSRFFAQLAAVNKNLYLLGGATVDPCGTTSGVTSVESYCPTSDTWTILESNLAPRAECGCTVINNKIYVVGGYNWDVGERLKTAEVYDVETDTVETIGEIAVALTGIACCATSICDLKLKSRQQADKGNIGNTFNTCNFYHHCSQSSCELTENTNNQDLQKTDTSTAQSEKIPNQPNCNNPKVKKKKSNAQANCRTVNTKNKKSGTQANCGNVSAKRKKSSTQSIIMPRIPQKGVGIKYAQRYRLTRAISCEPPINKCGNNPETTLKLPKIIPETKAMRE